MKTQKQNHYISSTALAAISHVIGVEGGYVNDRTDRGGETHFGISKRAYPNLDIKNLTREEAESIYYRDYWQAMHLDEFQPAVGFQLFDMAVNQGRSFAARMLQRVIHATADGVIGPQTLSIANAICPSKLIKTLTDKRMLHYGAIVKNDAFQNKYIIGWLFRAMQVRDAALRILGDENELG